MALFTRREKPPPEITAELERDERVLSWADTDGGDVVVATTLGLWWPGDEGRRRIPWQHVDKATWWDNILTVVEADVVDDELLVDRPPVHATLAVPRDLPPVVRKRVESTVIRSELLRVPGGTVRFVARRRPGRDGVVWWARLEPGTRADATVRSAISARLAVLRAQQP